MVAQLFSLQFSCEDARLTEANYEV